MTTIDHIAQVLTNLEAAELQNTRLRAENAALRDALENARDGIKSCYGGMGPGSTIWGNTQYDQAYSNAITAALTAFDHATAALSPQDANPAPNPPETPAESATGHGSAGNGGAS